VTIERHANEWHVRELYVGRGLPGEARAPTLADAIARGWLAAKTGNRDG
jgi:hypothetical protein